MAPKTSFATTPSGYVSGQNTRDRKRSALFRHTNQTFISKPSDLPPSPGGSIFSASTSSFTFTAGGSVGNPVKSTPTPPTAAPSTIPTFKFTNSQYPSDTGRSGSSDSGSRSQSMDSLTSEMAGLKVQGVKPKNRKGDSEVASLSASSSSGTSKTTPPSVEDGSTEESSQGETSAESDLSSDEDSVLTTHMGLLQRRPELDELNEIRTTPIFTEAVRKYAHSLAVMAKEQPFSQYGLLAGDLTGSTDDGSDPRIFWNIAAPSSFFICGSQGSGKSHTLSCLLENALAPCKANVLPRPLTGIVFHYDTFISDSGGSPCEVAWLSSNRDIKVRVLCPPTNIRTMQVSFDFF